MVLRGYRVGISNYHPDNSVVKDGAKDLRVCPFPRVIEECGAIVGIDVKEIGRGDKYCGEETLNDSRQHGVVYMTCRDVYEALAKRFEGLKVSVSKDDLLRLPEMEIGEREDVLGRLEALDGKEGTLGMMTAAYLVSLGLSSKHPSEHPPDSEIVAWAQMKLKELKDKASTCPLAPEPFLKE